MSRFAAKRRMGWRTAPFAGHGDAQTTVQGNRCRHLWEANSYRQLRTLLPIDGFFQCPRR